MERERRGVRRRLAVVAILLLALGVLLLATLVGVAREQGGSDATGTHTFRPPVGAGGTAPFAVEGAVHGIGIGVWKPVAVTIENRNAFPIRVTSLTVTVTGNPPGCPAAVNFETRQAAPFTVPAGAHAYRVPVGKTPRVMLVNRSANQDACKGQSFGLVFRGAARKLS